MLKKESKNYRTKRPSKILYILLGGLVTLYAVIFKKHKVIYELPKDLRPPFIIVGNHTSFFDFVYATRAFYPERINFVVARKYFMIPVGTFRYTAKISFMNFVLQTKNGV